MNYLVVYLHYVEMYVLVNIYKSYSMHFLPLNLITEDCQYVVKKKVVRILLLKVWPSQ